MTKITAHRYHDISCGHRVVGHEGKCVHLHGHNYRIHFECSMDYGGLDELGRVIDFGVIKSRLCMWLESNWDHRMILWDQDPLLFQLHEIDPQGVVAVPFNPTAENIGAHLLEVIGPQAMRGTGVTLTKVTVEETRKCGATVHA
jgi:6-pyruvoyltetrahydropterin/6-carboxytetrahydropterin synthase